MAIEFRLATLDDVPRIAEIYSKIHDSEEAGKITTGWLRPIYPTYESALESVTRGDMYVETDDGLVVAAGKLNKDQVHPAYDEADWLYDAKPEQVMVLHTLVVDPDAFGKKYGPSFVEFYEEFAKANKCNVLRIDTNERNAGARKMYKRLGYREASIIPCVFNGIPSVNLVCLEKSLEEE